jgi:Ca2+-binding RTX toxin-like protein
MPLSDRGENGHAYYPSSHWKGGGDIFLDVGISTNSTTSNRAEEGFYGYNTILHELGHALGLKHPFAEASDPPDDVNLGTNEDLRVFSVMSYTDFRPLVPQFTAEKDADGGSTVRAEYQQTFPRSFMVYDIAALQALYGADTTTMSGNNTYFFDPPGTVRTALYAEGSVHYPLPVYVTLWDGGGEDTIDLSATKHKNIVRLKPGSYSDIDLRDIDTQIREQQQRYAEELGTNYYDSWVRDVFTKVSDQLYTGEKALGIAYGTVIENVIGGSADDIFYDNQVDNKLFGGDGNDSFYLGEGGYDTIDGGQGQDTVILPVSRDTVTIQQSGTETIVVAEHFAARLIGVESLKFSDGTLSLV